MTISRRKQNNTSVKAVCMLPSSVAAMSAVDETTRTTSASGGADSLVALARQGSTAVRRLKRAVLTVLVLALLTAATLVYVVSLQDEQQSFETSVRHVSKLIVVKAESQARDWHHIVRMLSSTVTTNAYSSRATWPFVTDASLATLAQQASIQAMNSGHSNATQLASVDSSLQRVILAPLVPQTQRIAWEEYASVRTRADLAIHALDDSLDTNASSYLVPIWQMEPPATEKSTCAGLDLASHPQLHRVIAQVLDTRDAALAPLLPFDALTRCILPINNDDVSNPPPRALLVYPVWASLDGRENATMVGLVLAVVSWDHLWQTVAMADGMVVVLHSTCGPDYTYEIKVDSTAHNTSRTGQGDLHEPSFDHLRTSVVFDPFRGEGIDASRTSSVCQYTLDIYPTTELQAKYSTRQPVLYTLAVILIFILTSMVFVLYDRTVHQRQAKTMQAAAQANALLSDMFPETIQKRIFQESMDKANRKKTKRARILGSEMDPQPRKDADVNDTNCNAVDSAGRKVHSNGVTAYTTKPIADLFPETTILFADIGGFDCWSSVREPSQVFTLLETVYGTFDKVAKVLKIFKVETIGDCYVAVAGLPVARSDHAEVMALFATECMRRFENMSKKLEVLLGPGTASLALRVGMHSGPVIAGVLRSEKARFQLFGDTMNVASRMESTGERGRIQVSEDTADLLGRKAYGIKLTSRDKKVEAKGKGLLQTYWLDSIHRRENSWRCKVSCAGDEIGQNGAPEQDDRSSSEQAMNRLVDWNANNLVHLLRVVQARRAALKSTLSPSISEDNGISDHPRGLEVVHDVVALPPFVAPAAEYKVEISDLRLKSEVVSEARAFVQDIASMYNKTPFHCFEHASHVVMSVLKLLARISADKAGAGETPIGASQHHQDTYGISSDPLTCFACVFSALIHDVDHSGIPNVDLIKENAQLARMYREQSVAEQNSVDVAWNLLMEDRFANFRSAIFTNKDEQKRFRKLIVTSVIATDVMDKNLKELRNKRWDIAFGTASVVSESASTVMSSSSSSTGDEDRINHKATVVIEHLIQASDVCHTMQHWHVYRMWNERLYLEMHQAYMDGRTDVDPTERWYEGELGFFDFYIIPLAKKLAHCDVFGVCSFEYLNFALHNREEWESKGRDIVQEMKQNAMRKLCS